MLLRDAYSVTCERQLRSTPPPLCASDGLARNQHHGFVPLLYARFRPLTTMGAATNRPEQCAPVFEPRL